MGKIKLTESQLRNIIQECIVKSLNESVYMSGKNDRNKTVNLTYRKGNSINALNSHDILGTTLMDKDNKDTYEVPLKGGIMSYNITSIHGNDIMHFFKKKFDKCNAIETDIAGEKYKLLMNDDNFNDFLKQFTSKVNNVITYYIRQMQLNDKIGGISIYPVPSSSLFNKTMADIMVGFNLCNLPSQTIDENLLKKDLRNLQLDKEYVDSNQDFYNGKLYKNSDDNSSIVSHINTVINKQNLVKNQITRYVNSINDTVKKMLTNIYQHKDYYLQNFSLNEERGGGYEKDLVYDYRFYCDLLRECNKLAFYNDESKGKLSKMQQSQYMSIKKSSKPASIQQRTDFIWNIVRRYLRGINSPIDNNPYVKTDIQLWDIKKFEIKSLVNPIRMGLKNIYNPNEDTDFLKKELDRIKGTIFVIFDDNLSGGATLSDICYQCKELGIEHILPITFGKMTEKMTNGRLILNKPNDKKQEKVNNPQAIKENMMPNEGTTILWLDDLRNPNTYFNKKLDVNNKTMVKNFNHYKPLLAKNNFNYVWVKNYNEFTNYLMNNQMPDYVSFDYDLGKGERKGIDCVTWLINFCKQNSIQMPTCFVHSANKNGSSLMNKALGLPNDFDNL